MVNQNRFKAIVLAAALALAVAVPIAIAQSSDSGQKGTHQFGRGHGGRGAMAGAMFRNLDLTDAQKAQMKQIRETHSQTLRPLMQQIRAKRQEMRQASANGAFDEATVTQKLNEIAPLEAKLMGEEFRTHQEMMAVLTPDQKTKLDQLRAQQKAKWAERGAKKTSSK